MNRVCPKSHDTVPLKQGCGSAFILYGYGFFGSKTTIYLSQGLHIHRTSMLQKKPSALKRTSNTFFYFCGSFLPSWIWIRIPNTDPDPLTWLNPDPIGIRIRIRNPAQTWGIFALVFNHWVTLTRNREVRHLFYWDFKEYTKTSNMGAPAKKTAINSCHHGHTWVLTDAKSRTCNLLLVYFPPFKAKLQYSANVVMQI